jgi:hypothetical protein
MSQNEPDGESRMLHVRIPDGLAAGVYFLRMTGADEKVITKKIIVQ